MKCPDCEAHYTSPHEFILHMKKIHDYTDSDFFALIFKLIDQFKDRPCGREG